jgi:hypothetical protein
MIVGLWSRTVSRVDTRPIGALAEWSRIQVGPRQVGAQSGKKNQACAATPVKFQGRGLGAQFGVAIQRCGSGSQFKAPDRETI